MFIVAHEKVDGLSILEVVPDLHKNLPAKETSCFSPCVHPGKPGVKKILILRIKASTYFFVTVVGGRLLTVIFIYISPHTLMNRLVFHGEIVVIFNIGIKEFFCILPPDESLRGADRELHGVQHVAIPFQSRDRKRIFRLHRKD